MLAARADGNPDAAEQTAIHEAVERIGPPDVSRLAEQVSSGTLRIADLAAHLSDDEARRAAYTTALTVCHADGPAITFAATYALGHVADQYYAQGPRHGPTP